MKENFDLFHLSLIEEETALFAAMEQKKRYYVSTPEMPKRMCRWFLQWVNKNKTTQKGILSINYQKQRTLVRCFNFMRLREFCPNDRCLPGCV